MFKLFRKKQFKPERYWDFPYANEFLSRYKNDIELFELCMLEDYFNVCETFIENGNVIRALDASYQLYYGNIDGVIYTVIDVPCIHVIYKGGDEEWIACYRDLNGVEKYEESHRKLKKGELI